MLRTFREQELLLGPGKEDGIFLLKRGHTLSGKTRFCHVVGESVIRQMHQYHENKFNVHLVMKIRGFLLLYFKISLL